MPSRTSRALSKGSLTMKPPTLKALSSVNEYLLQAGLTTASKVKTSLSMRKPTKTSLAQASNNNGTLAHSEDNKNTS